MEDKLTGNKGEVWAVQCFVGTGAIWMTPGEYYSAIVDKGPIVAVIRRPLGDNKKNQSFCLTDS